MSSTVSGKRSINSKVVSTVWLAVSRHLLETTLCTLLSAIVLVTLLQVVSRFVLYLSMPCRRVARG
jgi:TRAP-type C4-dicarboxylate transport system permease small subunit